MELSPSYEPVHRRKVYEQIAEQLLAQIGSRRLGPGDSLPPERELTQSFGVGRSSIREALRMLESQGVISALNGGAFVVTDAAAPLASSLRLMLDLDRQSGMHDLYELRRILESEAAALAAERRTDAHLAELDAALAEVDAAVGAGGDAFVDADVRFHLAVADATGNRLVLHSMQAVRDIVHRAVVTTTRVPDTLESAVAEHRAIQSAIADGDSARARQAMHDHLIRVEADFEKGAVS